jgi:hypothetical protein
MTVPPAAEPAGPQRVGLLWARAMVKVRVTAREMETALATGSA